MDYKESIKRSIQFLVEADVPKYGDSQYAEFESQDKAKQKIELLLKDIRQEAGVYIQQEKHDNKLNNYLDEIVRRLLQIRAFQIGKPNISDTMKDVDEDLDKRIK